MTSKSINRSGRAILRHSIALCCGHMALCWALVLGCGVVQAQQPAEDATIRIAIMDPLAAPLSCACVKGLGQRQYPLLAKYLEQRLARPVDLVFEESLDLVYRRAGREIDFVIGKWSVVQFDAKKTGTQLRPLLMLADGNGSAQMAGIFVMRNDDPAVGLPDLKGRRIMLGPKEDAETHQAALDLLRRSGLESGCQTQTAQSIESAVFAVADGDIDAAVISEYLPPLLEGCGKIAPGSLRVVGRTEPLPFVAIFATERASPQLENQVTQSLLNVTHDARLLEALESKLGFLPLSAAQNAAANVIHDRDDTGWTDWRGPGRRGNSDHVPLELQTEPRLLWTAKVTGPALAGIAATRKFVVVPDKDAKLTSDVFRCFDAETGAAVWTIEYPAATAVDYTNAPRATPVIHDGLVYLQGALGDLHCAELSTGRIVWRKDLLRDFTADPLTWGCSIPPLVVDDKLIVTPGAKDASVVALDRKTGKVLWQAPGHAAAYAAFVFGKFGGVDQIVGYDVAGLGGWDPQTGRRLWELVPRGQSDFHVATPVPVSGGLLLATENNATRRYGFDDQGRIHPVPIAANQDLAPDTCTPVVLGHRVFCSAYGELFCLDLHNDLRTIWSVEDDLFFDHTNLIAGNGRVLVWTTTGDLLLVRGDTDHYELLAHVRPFADEAKCEAMSHPAIVGDRLYLRSQTRLACLSLKPFPAPGERADSSEPESESQ